VTSEQEQMLADMGLSNLDNPPKVVPEPFPGTPEEWVEFITGVPGTYLLEYIQDSIEVIYHDMGSSSDMVAIYRAQGGLATMQLLQEMLTEASTQVKETDNDHTSD